MALGDVAAEDTVSRFVLSLLEPGEDGQVALDLPPEVTPGTIITAEVEWTCGYGARHTVHWQHQLTAGEIATGQIGHQHPIEIGICDCDN